jgi:hypothetical protein
MSRIVTIWEVWSDYDGAETDTFVGSKGAAIKAAINLGATGKADVSDNGDKLEWKDDQGFTIHARRLELPWTKQGVCQALMHWPNR